MTVIRRCRMHQRDNCDECFDWQAEAERLRAEWRKADDGWIACRQQLEGAVDLLREIAESDPVDNALDPGRNVRIAAAYFAPSTTTGGQ
jgi:hypothetical protein